MTTAARCRRCHRPLSVAASVKRGIGPVCARREALEQALTQTADGFGFSAAQQATAAEAFADGAVALDLAAHRALVVATDGAQVHHVALARMRCDCDAAVWGSKCWHQLATLTALTLGAPAAAPVAA